MTHRHREQQHNDHEHRPWHHHHNYENIHRRTTVTEHHSLLQESTCSSSPLSSLSPAAAPLPLCLHSMSRSSSSSVTTTPMLKSTSNPSVLVPTTTTTTTTQRSSPLLLHYLACQLQRPLHVSHWGMSLSYMKGGYLVVGQASAEHVSNLMSWWKWWQEDDDNERNRQVASHQVNWNMLLHAPDLHPTAFRSCFSTISSSSSSSSYSTYSTTTPTICSGDWIVSVNGYGIASYFSSLSHVTRYMRQCHQLSLVIVRHEYAHATALQIMTCSHRNNNKRPAPQGPGGCCETVLDRACRAAQAAWDIYKQVLPPHHPAMMVATKPSQPIMPSMSSLSSSTLPTPTTTTCPTRNSSLPRFVSVESDTSSTATYSNRWSNPRMVAVANPLSATVSPSYSHVYSPPHHHLQANHQHARTVSTSSSSSLSTLPPHHVMLHPTTSLSNDNKSVAAYHHSNNHNSNNLNHSNDRNQEPLPKQTQSSLSLHPSLVVSSTTALVDEIIFSKWLKHRKNLWRNTRRKAKKDLLRVQPKPALYYYEPRVIRNPLFQDAHGLELPYDDDQDDAMLLFDPEEGIRWRLFLPTNNDNDNDSFRSWLSNRKTTWRNKWKMRELPSPSDDSPLSSRSGDDDDVEHGDSLSRPSIDFWTMQSYPSFDHWLAASTEKWKLSYSWNRNKRKRLEMESEEIVRFPSSYHHHHHTNHKTNHAAASCHPSWELEFLPWLRVRKHQWRIQRRKRQRILRETSISLSSSQCSHSGTTGSDHGCDSSSNPVEVTSHHHHHHHHRGPLLEKTPESPRPKQPIRDMIYIDALLDEMERRQKELDQRPPLDIAFFFDAINGVPDDVVAHCFIFLPPLEHGKLLGIDTKTRKALKQREELWRQLCPKHWTLPRRPRKPWHELYLSMLRMQEELSRKRSDDLLMNAFTHFIKGDHLQKIESLVSRAEKDFQFDINYTSGVVCERNGLLNLAVIYGRHKVVRWLMETKHADMESSDRGNFTPLLNAAWSGDKFLVRFLLSKGADRSKVGTGHFSQALAPPDFRGLTAEGWARKRGHGEIALLLATGL